MKDIKIPQTSSRGGKIQGGGVVMATKLIKKSVRIDSAGNQIDPITKEIIKYNKYIKDSIR